MSCELQPGTILWRIHLASSCNAVFEALTTDTGRATFWAETTTTTGNVIEFQFPNGIRSSGTILETHAPQRFCLTYFGNRVDILLDDDGCGGTDLTLVDHGATGENREETRAGWVSVLMSLKAAVDHGIDLRNHDRSRTWDDGYVDN